MTLPGSAAARSLAVVALLAAALLCPSAAGAVTRDELARYSAAVERSWADVTDERGAVADALEPGRGRFNYGTLMLADAQLRGAARTGDRELANAAVRQVLGTIERGGPQDTYYLLGAGTILRNGLAGSFPERSWERIAAPLTHWLGSFPPYVDNNFADPTHYSNRKLVWAVGAVALAQSGVPATAPGAQAADPAALRAEVTRVVSSLAVEYAARHAYSDGLSPLRASSDRVHFPNAYHVFSIYLLELLHAADPAVFSPEALALREDAGRYALSLMAPDGQLTHAGRSLEQSWVLAAAAAYGARRAAQGGPQAGAFRAFADRAATRLLHVHGRLSDGTIPIVPGLHAAYDRRITDSYAAMTQYNGLTLMMLEDAVAQWPDAVAPSALPADGRYLVADLAGSGLVWGRSQDVWWAFSGRGSQGDPRYEQGLVSVKVLGASGWTDILAARGITGGPRSRWLLKTRRGRARLRLTRVHGNGRKVRMTGNWRLLSDNRRYRKAAVELTVARGGVRVVTRLRRDETLTASIWKTDPRVSPVAASGRTRMGGCRVTASGPACPFSLRWRGRGLIGLRLPGPAAP
ncbi:MAG: hypothetical protein AVDCRST_MAG69-107 [uncultured Solirubrobacteraceae bacterium]|uniref:Uncharacterized protein n=1 Tax=uncultured Solirubrobacteraceae bacterium TaxID=1162706 RepID=A0A6J4RK76_9ACTN|nr:MAG: hypothetical protein AVDCRST_MAG69-107 [uncultured Solirubrobacteraceae bacterium]